MLAKNQIYLLGLLFLLPGISLRAQTIHSKFGRAWFLPQYPLSQIENPEIPSSPLRGGDKEEGNSSTVESKPGSMISPITPPPTHAPKYFSLNPGVTLESVTVDISGRGNNATMTQAGPGKSTWMLDIKSKDFQIGEWYGIHLLLHNSSFDLNNQFVPKPPSGPSTSDSGGSSSGSTSNTSPTGSGDRVKADLNTRMEGVYSMAIPIFYLGKSNSDSFRFGLGVGPSQVRLNGNVDFSNPLVNLAIGLGDSSNRTLFLNNISAIQFGLGNVNPSTGDPVVTYLLANLSTGNNLELLGLYLASKGLLHPDPFALGVLAMNPGLYTPLEALTIGSLARTQVSFSASTFTSFLFFFETPRIFDIVRFRLAFGGPIFHQNGYTYEFRTFHLALYVPVEF
ncbi:hypothetical protein CH373_02680 [Leptospira perolatii]|uniref:Uncharacterized protein n=1 Tax=Leptospira perolatii TaxID=2023191 RepID=A0A2M9ZS87_9LEPT|nr:hypothetical protein [Leptospira perolatii]PJZ71423.1 hypothetical protein CH360_02680 [Leptospira perolatii]PJZ74957.1 hypothetical protein CH373_02680 [Leptospira perolatii]